MEWEEKGEGEGGKEREKKGREEGRKGMEKGEKGVGENGEREGRKTPDCNPYILLYFHNFSVISG